MALQLGALREALLDGGTSAELATKAAEELAGYDSRFASLELKIEQLSARVTLMQWQLGLSLGLNLTIIAKLFL